jgi:glycosyltransferase involved in cell wall biosynthesis
MQIADCGVDLEAFTPGDAHAARAKLGWDGEGPAFVCVGSLIERKNVVRLADAFSSVGRGRLAFVGDGELRGEVVGRESVLVTGRIPQADVREWLAACDVLCQPSLIEPFGQATLEAMAMERTVVATTVGGPSEFVTADAGVLVDPHDTEALARALTTAAQYPTPNSASRKAAAEHDVRVQVGRMADILERAARAR